MLKVRQVAERLGLSNTCIYGLVASGKLPSQRFGNGRGTIRVSDIDLQAFIEGCRSNRVEPLPANCAPARREKVFKHLRLNRGRSPAHSCNDGAAVDAEVADSRLSDADESGTDSSELPTQ